MDKKRLFPKFSSEYSNKINIKCNDNSLKEIDKNIANGINYKRENIFTKYDIIKNFGNTIHFGNIIFRKNKNNF